MNYDYSRRKVQYSEFWAVVRTGGGKLTQQNEPMYIFDIPLSTNVSDLSLFHLSFNISTQTDTSFWVPVQMISALSNPNFIIFDSEWINNYVSTKDEEDWNYIMENFGKSTPRNITITYMETILQISANNSQFIKSLGNYSNIKYTEKDGSLVGFVYDRYSEIVYNQHQGFIFYIADENNSILHLDYNSNNSWSFSLMAYWNITFEQKYGSNINFAGNASIAHWIFQKQNNSDIKLSININNTHFNGPIPTFTIIQRSLWIESIVLGFGVILTISVTLYNKIYFQKKDRNHSKRVK
ncbi:hypothetical protein LCGC14_0824610 [marine sediment metagenome]|uniref:Uncharacterized protein n=1 Tax=marine sediment metagenome TaxID=412755 RepID=A0A0F9PHR2_9ZZZZ